MKEDAFDFLWLLTLCKKNIKLITVILFLTVIASSLVSVFVIESKFQSSVLIYPTTTNSVSQALLIKHNPYRKDVLEFGEEEEAEQLLQILNSDEIRFAIVDKYNLYDHYGVSKTDEFHQTTIKKIYESAITIKKTKFNSIEIVVLDKNPEMASNIANEHLHQLDVVINRVRETRASQALIILEKRKQLLYQERNTTQDSLQYYRQNGIISITAQTERLTEQYAIALAANNIAGANRIRKELDHIAEYAGGHDMLLRKTYAIEEELSLIEFETDRLSIDKDYSLENKFIINQAYPADKKSYPIRWLIVFTSVISVFVFTMFCLCVRDYLNCTDDK